MEEAVNFDALDQMIKDAEKEGYEEGYNSAIFERAPRYPDWVGEFSVREAFKKGLSEGIEDGREEMLQSICVD